MTSELTDYKQHLITFFIEKRVLSDKSGMVLRPWNWKSHFDLECEQRFNDFAKSYRSPEEAWFCLCRKIELPVCPICGQKKVKFTGITKNGQLGYNTTCEDCSANALPEKVKKFKKTRSSFSDEREREIFEKRQQTNLERYGSRNYTLRGSKSFKDNLQRKYSSSTYNNPAKIKQTCLERYGEPTNLLIPDVHQRGIEKSWSEESVKKRIKHNLEKYGKAQPVYLSVFSEQAWNVKHAHIHQIELAHDCTLKARVTKKYGQGYKCLGLEYLKFGNNVYVSNADIPLIEAYHKEGFHSNGYTSKPEKDLLAYVKSIYSGTVLENVSSVVPNENHRFFELDIYIPEKHLAIDFNGVYWHSTKYKDDFYHQRKTACCRKSKVEMLHVFEDVWNANPDLYRKIIKEVIDGTYRNVIREENGMLIGDNSFPILGDYQIVSISAPTKHHVYNLEYYDCGEVHYQLNSTQENGEKHAT